MMYYSPVNDYPNTNSWTNVQQSLQDPLLNRHSGLVNSAMILQSPGGWSGWGSYADPYAQQQMPVWDRQISGYQNVFEQVTNTHYYHPNAFEQNLNYWDNRAYTLGSSSSSYSNLGYTLDSVAPGISDLMDQSTGPLAGYSVTGSSLNGLLSMF